MKQATLASIEVQSEITELRIQKYEVTEMVAFLWMCEINGLMSYDDTVTIYQELTKREGQLVLFIRDNTLISFRVEHIKKHESNNNTSPRG